MLDKCIQNDQEEIGTKRVKAIPRDASASERGIGRSFA